MADSSGVGEIAAAKRKRANLPSGSDFATVENRISELPDDVLAKILFSVSTPDAVRTCILSKRWRPMWKLLPELRLLFFPEPASKFRDALDGHQVPLDHLQIERSRGPGTVPALSLATWLPAAARRVSGSFALLNLDPMSDKREEETIELPCFEKATSIRIWLASIGNLAMPPADAPGVFSHLTDLCLECIWFRGPSELDDAVSSARCPCLQRLKVRDSRGLETLNVRSRTLLKMELLGVVGLRELTVEAPELKEFTVVYCFEFLEQTLVVAISAPGLVLLDWRDTASQRYLQPSQLPRSLRTLGNFLLFVYGDESHLAYNKDCQDLLKGFRFIDALALILGHVMDIYSTYQYLMEDMRLLPDPTTLHLTVISCGHSFGASLFDVLRMCPGIRKLVVKLPDNLGLEEPSTCPLGCICRQKTNWQTEQLALVRLQEIEIQRFGHSTYDIGFVEKLFGWAPTLTKVTITFDTMVTEGIANEWCKMFQLFTRPEICIEFRYCKNSKMFHALEGQGTV